MSAQSRLRRLRSVCLGTPECVVVQLANRRKLSVEIQWNPDGDTPSICVVAHTDLRICGGHGMLFYTIYWPPAKCIKIILWLLRQYNKPYSIMKSIYFKLVQ